MREIFVWLLALFLLNVSPALAGEQLLIQCANPACTYTGNLTLGGARLSPGITCYCTHCWDFVRLKLQNWDQYRDQKYYCPNCGRAATPIYSQDEIPTFPCPRCGKL